MRVVAAAVLGLALALGAGPASADEGGARSSPRPPSVVLRHVDAPVASVAPARRDVVVLVGGFASAPDDGMFDAIASRLRAAGYDVVRFGDDERFAYDTLGSIDASARSLSAQVRSLASEHRAVHIIAHSMGGVVADAALAHGLGRSDGVATYVALAVPHAGSSLAVVPQIALAVSGDARPDMVALFGGAIDSTAARELARMTPAPTPRGVVRIDLREATDWTVGRDDTRAKGALSRTLPSLALDGHGDIVRNDAALDLIERTIADRRVPGDDRTARLAAAGMVQGALLDRWRSLALGCLLLGSCALALSLRLRRALDAWPGRRRRPAWA